MWMLTFLVAGMFLGDSPNFVKPDIRKRLFRRQSLSCCVSLSDVLLLYPPSSCHQFQKEFSGCSVQISSLGGLEKSASLL